MNEYNSVNDLKYFLLELADYFEMSNENILKVKRWIHHFRYNEVNMLGITASPEYSISLYNRETTEFK